MALGALGAGAGFQGGFGVNWKPKCEAAFWVSITASRSRFRRQYDAGCADFNMPLPAQDFQVVGGPGWIKDVHFDIGGEHRPIRNAAT